MITLKKYMTRMLLVLVLLTSVCSFADDNDDPDAPPTDPGTEAPISDYIPLLLIGGLYLGYTRAERKSLTS